ncbi:MAG: hypothetical protein G01um1014106_352, partial [Parcubacteria group bacterium Gr01-1014_106]
MPEDPKKQSASPANSQPGGSPGSVKKELVRIPFVAWIGFVLVLGVLVISATLNTHKERNVRLQKDVPASWEGTQEEAETLVCRPSGTTDYQQEFLTGRTVLYEKNSSLFQFDLGTREVKELIPSSPGWKSPGPSVASRHVLSPDNLRIAFYGYDGHGFPSSDRGVDLWVYELGSGKLRKVLTGLKLPFSELYNSNPHWTPNSTS